MLVCFLYAILERPDLTNGNFQFSSQIIAAMAVLLMGMLWYDNDLVNQGNHDDCMIMMI